MPKLTQINVESLLATFDYQIEFPEYWNILLIHGPNGVGKTKVLKLIDAIFRGDYKAISLIPFGVATLVFDDRSIIEVVNVASLEFKKNDQLFDIPEEFDPTEEEFPPIVKYRLTDSFGEITLWEPRDVPRHRASARRLIERESRYLQVSNNRWRDRATGTVVGLSQLLSENPRLRHYFADAEFGETHPPSSIERYIDSIPVHLIETQRLYLLTTTESDGRSRGEKDRSIVNKFSNQIVEHMNNALRQNSITSQGLDQTFPERLLDEDNSPPDITEEYIRQRYDDQSRLRERLADVFSIDYVRDLPLRDTPLRTWEMRVLWTYLNDTDEKLESLSRLLDRVDLLVEIINSRFRRKSLQVTSTDGFKVTSETGPLNPTDLSSGEQHELVLLYDLLFNVQDGSLVLIDEPEISLHVSWQQRFVRDIDRIAKITGARFIVATHSPQIMHRWWSQAVALGVDTDAEADA